MDEARRVIERLERIEELRRDRAPAAALLDEVRGLLRDGETWLAAERKGSASPGLGGVERGLARAAEELGRTRSALGEATDRARQAAGRLPAAPRRS
jgi:hypothetical protein